MKLVIDAGHGYKPVRGGIVYDPGAVGRLGNAVHHEATIAQHYALSVKYYLHTLSDGAVKIALLIADAPENALSLQARRRAHQDAQAFISLHCNAATHSTAQGYETLYTLEHSLPLARVCHSAMQQAFVGRIDRGIKQQGLTVCRREQPAVLLELGFMTNPSDLAYLLRADTRKRFARILAQYLLDWLSVEAR